MAGEFGAVPCTSPPAPMTLLVLAMKSGAFKKLLSRNLWIAEANPLVIEPPER
jgi:hypothetical protein